MKSHKSTSDDFSFIGGGLFTGILARQKLFDTENKLAILSICIAWLPLLIITVFEGTLFAGVQMPFYNDIAMHTRLLIALPMLLLIKSSINYKVIHVSKHIIHELVSPEDRDQALKKYLLRAKQFINSPLSEIIMILMVIGSTISLVKGGVYSALGEGNTSWMAYMTGDNQKLSVAGYWSVFISIPLTQFLLLRWIWHYLVWIMLLYRISKVQLHLLPTHADKSGGLGIIILAQRSFGLLFVAAGVILSGQLIAMITNAPETFPMIRSVALGYIVMSVVFLIFPLVFFSRKLYKTKCDGLMNLGNLSTGLSGKFEREWVNKTPVDKILHAPGIDPSLIFDYAGMYTLLEEFRIIPLTIHDIMALGAMLSLPFIPILFIHFSLGELMQKIAGLVL